jgi:hypothetical protein
VKVMVTRRLLKSKRFWTGAVLCLVAIAIIGIWIAIPKPGVNGINRQNFRKIQVGMSLDEVTALMGCPLNYAGPILVISKSGPDESIGDTTKPGSQAWLSDSGCIIVGLDENDRVSGAGFNVVEDNSNSFIGRKLAAFRHFFGL